MNKLFRCSQFIPSTAQLKRDDKPATHGTHPPNPFPALQPVILSPGFYPDMQPLASGNMSQQSPVINTTEMSRMPQPPPHTRVQQAVSTGLHRQPGFPSWRGEKSSLTKHISPSPQALRLWLSHPLPNSCCPHLML